MSAHPIYRLRKLSKSYGGAFTLRIEELQIARGEVFCLLGPTGSGKSTLLRLLAALEPPTGGELRFEEHVFDHRPLLLSVRRRITMVHQRPLLLDTTVRANVEYGLRLRNRRDGSPMVERMMECFGLTDLARRRARTLSVGQTQLVALMRALVVEPEVLLLDEPTSSLDPSRVAMIERVVREARQERRMTVLWASHSLFQARRVADRVGLLLDGQLVEVAPTDRFFGEPADPRTAAFIEGGMVY